MSKPARLWTVLIAIVVFTFSTGVPAHAASPWTKHESYAGKTAGKLGFGLKNAVFGWMQMFREAKLPKYEREWDGFMVGIARSVFYTANGLIHTATFFIPVDFPDMGEGI